MSVGTLANRTLTSRTLNAALADPAQYVRPSDWLTFTAPLASEEKFIGLHAVYPDSNFLALSAAGDYTVDWGDGLVESFSANVDAYHQYIYSDTYLTGTECSLGYKQAIVTVTPQVAGTFTALNLHKKHNQAGLQGYSSGFLDIAVSGQYLNITIGSILEVIGFYDLEQVNIVSSSITSAAYMFQNCYSLKSVLNFANSATDFKYMFYNSTSLVSVNLFNTASGLNFTYMFYNCNSLVSVPLFDTTAGTDFTYMFYNCRSLISVPAFNTVGVVNFSYMFYNCRSLSSVPLLNTAAGVNLSYMFGGCYNLTSVPLLDVGSGTDFLGMFLNCPSLSSASLLSTKASLSYTACKLSKAALEGIFDNAGKITGSATLTISNNWGAPLPVALSATTTADSTTIAMSSTLGLEIGMQVEGSGTALSSGAYMVFTDATNQVTANWSTIVEGDVVWFSTLATTTGLDKFTPYYVINYANSTFQLSLTLGGSAIDLVSDGTGGIRVANFITEIVPNVSITVSRKSISSATVTLSFRHLQTWKALSKGWSISG